MSEGTIGIIILLGISVAAALVFHQLFPRRFALASLLSAAIASPLFLVVATLREGHLDPFAPIALVTGAAVAFVVALVVGAIVRSLRPAS